MVLRLLLLLFVSIAELLAVENIDLLLEEYKSESELSKKTKDENAGHLTVFTRDDLERMQAETLKDVLKSMRFFRYLENRVNEPDMLNMDPVAYSTKSVRIYLNENELAIPISGSGFLMFGNIDMDFIDHVEIYQGFPSFEFGVEPAIIVIRLYTKVAQRDAGTRVKVLSATNNANKLNVYTAGFMDDTSYFAYANHSDNRQDTYSADSQTIKRDVVTNNFYGSLSKDNYKIELNALKSKRDALLGLLPYAAPKETNIKREFINASFNSKLLNESLTLALSYVHSKSSYDSEYAVALPPVFGGFSKIEQADNSDSLTAIVQKKLTLDSHAISIGFQYRYKYFNFDNIKYDSITQTGEQKYDSENIYSLYLEDSISITNSSLFGLSVMQQYYDRNKDMKDESITQLRLSYIYAQDKWVYKVFASRQEFIPEPYMTAQVHIGNPELNPEIYASITQEVNYKTSNTISKFIFGYADSDGFLIPDNLGVMQNSSKNLATYFTSLEFIYSFRKKDKLEFKFDYENIDGPGEGNQVEHYNYSIRALNTVASFDIFNEIIINRGFKGSDTGYDYSAGIRYAVIPDLHINLKGENIFNSGLKKKYYYNIFPTTKQLEVPVVEQKFMISMDYLF